MRFGAGSASEQRRDLAADVVVAERSGRVVVRAVAIVGARDAADLGSHARHRRGDAGSDIAARGVAGPPDRMAERERIARFTTVTPRKKAVSA